MWDAITEKEIEFGLSFLLKMTPSTKNVAFQRKFFRNIVRNQGKKRLAFKITGPSRLEFLLSIFPDANIVRIQRGTIATIRSLLKVHFWKSRGYHKFWWKGAYNADECEWAIKNTDNPIAITAYQVQRIVDITNYEIQKLQPIVLDIEYETFVRSPENTINEILDFANLPKDDSCFNYLKENKIFNRNRNLNDFFEENDIDTINTTINLSSSFFNPNKPIHC